MTTLSTLTNDAISELENLMHKKERNEEAIGIFISVIAHKSVPASYKEIIALALEDIHLAMDEPQKSPFKNTTPVEMIMSNIYWHIRTQLEGLVNTLKLPPSDQV